MTYDWEGTHTKRVRKMKICLAFTVAMLVIGLTVVQASVQIAWF